MPVVGTLTVNLEANTARFSGDLGKASQDAKSFGRSAEDAGDKAGYSMTEARHGVMMLGEEFGIHLPRGLTTFIASLGPVGAAMEAAFPFLAIILGATLLIEKLSKLGETSGKVTEAWDKYGEAVFTSGHQIQDEIDAEKRKLIELKDGPIAALEFAISHLGTTAFHVFKELSSQVNDAAAAMKTQAGWSNVYGDAAKDLEKFRDAMGKAMREASAAHPEDKLAAYNAAISMVQGKERELTALIAKRTAASGADSSAAVDGLHAERQAVNDLLPVLQQGIALDAEKQKVAGADLGAKQLAQEKHIAEERKKLQAEEMRAAEKVQAEQTRAAEKLQAAEGHFAVQQMFAHQKEADAVLNINRKLDEAILKSAVKSHEEQLKIQQHFARDQQRAEEQKVRDIENAELRMETAFARTAAHAIIESKSITQAFAQMGGQMVEQAITNLMLLQTVQGRKKLGDAKTAAADAFAYAGNPILGAVLAAGAFAAVMAFERGGEVPGSGAVPIIAHGGETVVTRALTEQVRNSTGGGNGRHNFHFSPVINAVDADGVDRMLTKHMSTFRRHMRSELRRMNQG